MQFKHILTFGLATAAFAAPAVDTTNVPMKNWSVQDLQSVTDTFNAIQAGIDKMAESVKSYSGDPAQLAQIQNGSDELLKIINDGAAKVAASPAMGLMDAINILGPVGTLSSKVDEIVIALANKKETFTQMNLGEVVKNDLSQQKSAAEGLVKNILANLPMPSLLGIVAGPIAKQITDKLEAGVKQWS